MADTTRNEDVDRVTYDITNIDGGRSVFIDVEKREDGQLHYHVQCTIPSSEQTWRELVASLDGELGV